MKFNYINLLSKLAGLTGIAGVSLLSLLVSVPAGAQQGVLNPNPSIFNEPPYAGKPRTQPGDVAPPSSPAPGETPATPPTTPPTTPPATPPTTPPTTKPTGEKPTPEGKDVVAVAEANGSFKTLLSALQAAGLTETLQGKGPFTVFAPSDEAFAKLPQDALQELLKNPKHKDVLRKILTYHVVPGQVLSSDIKPGKVKTVEGNSIEVKVDGATGVMVNDAKVVQPDVKASNGVIHVIDTVILPPDI